MIYLGKGSKCTVNCDQPDLRDPVITMLFNTIILCGQDLKFNSAIDAPTLPT